MAPARYFSPEKSTQNRPGSIPDSLISDVNRQACTLALSSPSPGSVARSLRDAGYCICFHAFAVPDGMVVLLCSQGSESDSMRKKRATT